MNLLAITIQGSLITKILSGLLLIWGIRALLIIGVLLFLYLQVSKHCHP